jgi:beta-N-acetylhexosaminidase
VHRTGARRTLPAFCALVLALLACPSAGVREAARITAAPPAAPETAAPTSSPQLEQVREFATPPSSAAPPTPIGPEQQARLRIQALDRDQQVRQLFLVGVPLADLAAGAGLVREGVGGVFLAGRSQAPVGELAAVTRQWQAAAPGAGLWVATDQEGGLVQALKGPGFARLPTAVQQGRLAGGQLAALADGMGASLAAAGVNLDLAPVADIVPAGTEAGNAPIGAFDRQYGATAAQVVPAARTVIERMGAHGVTATLKHFPGLGRVAGNTDTSPDVVDTTTTAGDEQVTAFGTLATGPQHPFVMASSATYAAIDPTERATFSRVVLTRLLRERLGFDGVVVSDSMGAAAVQSVPPGQRAVRFLAAGGTIVLITGPDLLPEMIAAVLDRDRRDPAFSAAVDDAVMTALVAKARAGLLR